MVKILVSSLTSDCYSCFRYSGDEIHFNLMAIVSDRKMCYEKKLKELTAKSEVRI